MYEHWRPLGAWQTEGQFSDGTLRLLGLLWAVLDRSGPLLLEEPELNLHPEVVRYLPQMFATMQRRAGRQVIISTHSADLLCDEGIGLDEVLLLKPQDEGTAVEVAKNIKDAEKLVEGGIPLPDVLLPSTRPDEARGGEYCRHDKRITPIPATMARRQDPGRLCRPRRHRQGGATL
jgi:hypothetical protein